MKIEVDAKIILTFPSTQQELPVEKYKDQIVFAVEQHLNSIGVITYKGDMIDTGAVQVGLRVHVKDYESTFPGEVIHQFPQFPKSGRIEPEIITKNKKIERPLAKKSKNRFGDFKPEAEPMDDGEYDTKD